MAFPSTLSSFARPNATDRLNNPSHSALHNTVSSALGQVEAVIGVDGANSVLGTIIGDLRSPGSGGGGHVQSVNKGGTGQTSYTKGDILVAQSSSVLTKLAIGSNSYVLTADTNQSSGIKWANADSVLGIIWKQIDEAVLTSDTSSIVASSLSGRQDLRFVLDCPGTSTGAITGAFLTFNNDTAPHYTSKAYNDRVSILASGGNSNIQIIPNLGNQDPFYVSADIGNRTTVAKPVFSTGLNFSTSSTVGILYENYATWYNTVSQISVLTVTVTSGSTGKMNTGTRLTVYAKGD